MTGSKVCPTCDTIVNANAIKQNFDGIDFDNAILNAAHTLVQKTGTHLTPEQAEPIIKNWLKDCITVRLQDIDHFTFIEEITNRKDWNQAELNAENEQEVMEVA